MITKGKDGAPGTIAFGSDKGGVLLFTAAVIFTVLGQSHFTAAGRWDEVVDHAATVSKTVS